MSRFSQSIPENKGYNDFHKTVTVLSTQTHQFLRQQHSYVVTKTVDKLVRGSNISEKECKLRFVI
jgi:predicted N-acyltransferase